MAWMIATNFIVFNTFIFTVVFFIQMCDQLLKGAEIRQKITCIIDLHPFRLLGPQLIQLIPFHSKVLNLSLIILHHVLNFGNHHHLFFKSINTLDELLIFRKFICFGAHFLSKLF